jgi:type VI secretion system secreted protein VgrG
MADSNTRHMVLHCPLGVDELEIRHMHGTERLSTCFEYVLTLYSKSPNIKAEDLLGQGASVSVQSTTQPQRAFDGIIAEFAYTGHARNHWTYRMVLRPWLWLLSRNNDCQIFQNQTTLEIAYSLFKGVSSDVKDQLQYALQPREYCVQYHESDLKFLMRLLEEEGIYFYFKHQLNMHTLMLVDSTNAHETVPKYETIDFRSFDSEGGKPSVCFASWQSAKRVLPGAVALNDYDFTKPSAHLDAGSSKPQEHKHAELEVYDYPAGYVEAAVGQDRARTRMEAITAGYETAHGKTDAIGLYAGSLFTLGKHRRDNENRQYLITEMTYDADSGMFESGGGEGLKVEGHVRALPADVPFRPHRHTPRPIMPGPQTATVVGPKGQEIWTDEYGRVKLMFHWDRLGKGDESSSCWVRVSQQWTGSGWGSLFTPRIGQEVVVEFLDGNPDRPLVTGCVYNGANKLPYELPKEANRSGWKTQSTPEGGKNDFNELRFVDEKDKEEVHFQAQRDYIGLIKRNSTTDIGANEVRHVKKNQTVELAEGNRRTNVKKGEMRSEVAKTYAVKANAIEHVASDSIILKVNDAALRMDGTSIQLSVGDTRITLELATLLVKGASVDINPPVAPPAKPIKLSTPPASDDKRK